MCRSARMRKKYDLETDATYLLRERLLSWVTPSSLTCGGNGTVLPAKLLFEREGRDAERCLVPIKMTSDLLGFKARPLLLSMRTSKYLTQHRPTFNYLYTANTKKIGMFYFKNQKEERA